MKRKFFILIEFILYISFITLDLLNINSSYIKYLSIVLCFVYSLTNHKKSRVISSLFTMIADFFLLMLDNYYELGLISFIVVQMSYLYFLGNSDKAYFNMFLYLRGLFIMMGIIILFILKQLSVLNILVIIYFINLVFNCIQAFILKQKTLALGLLLFICCDICVGLHNINSAYTIASFLMWVFYLPSQVLIVLA